MKNLIKTTLLVICSIFAFTASLSLHGQITAELQTQLNAETTAREAADATMQIAYWMGL